MKDDASPRVRWQNARFVITRCQIDDDDDDMIPELHLLKLDLCRR